MIGPRDRLWIAAKKLMLRKRWMLFTLFSLSLGLTVFTATTSLGEGVRTAFVNTIQLVVRRVPEDNIKIEPRDPKAPRTQGVHDQPITNADLAKIAAMPGIEAVSTMEVVTPVKLGLELDTADPITQVTGMEDAFLARFVPPGHGLWDAKDRIPIVVGRYLLQSRYDPVSQRFRVRHDLTDASFLGRELEITVGANVIESRFREDYREGKRRIVPTTREEQASRRAEQYRYLRNRYDLNIYQRALKLKARIVGLADSEHVLIPMSVAKDFSAWLKNREALALKQAEPGAKPPFEGHRQVWALARTPGDVPAAAAAIKAAGWHPTHRGSMTADAMEEFRSVMKVVSLIFYGIGAVIFAVSCLFVWSTMSRVISDSRREIGVFRAVGATRRDVLSIFLLQAILLGVAGAALGVVSGFGLAAGISKGVLHYAAKQDLHWDVEEYGFEAEDVLPARLYSVDPLACAAMILGAVLASLIAGVVPAWRAANMDPVAALQRRE